MPTHASSTQTFLPSIPTQTLCLRRLSAFFLSGQIPSLILRPLGPPPVEALGAIDEAGGVDGRRRKWRPRGGTDGDGGHTVRVFPDDEYGNAAAEGAANRAHIATAPACLRWMLCSSLPSPSPSPSASVFWQQVDEHGAVLLEALMGRVELCRLTGWRKFGGAADALFSTLENCEFALFEGWDAMHGVSFTDQSPEALRAPFTNVLEQIVRRLRLSSIPGPLLPSRLSDARPSPPPLPPLQACDPSRRQHLVTNQAGRGGSLAVPSVFVSQEKAASAAISYQIGEAVEAQYGASIIARNPTAERADYGAARHYAVARVFDVHPDGAQSASDLPATVWRSPPAQPSLLSHLHPLSSRYIPLAFCGRVGAGCRLPCFHAQSATVCCCGSERSCDRR